MKLPRLSTFPLHKPFERYEPDSEIAEITLRLVVNIYSDAAFVVGTATPICGNMLATARHVIEAIVENNPKELIVNGVIQNSLCAVQLVCGPEYIVWEVMEVWVDPISDLALLRVGANPRRSNPGNVFRWKQPRLNPFAPANGERVAAVGYRKCSVRVSKNAQGGPHVEIDGELMTSVGVVREQFELRRDQRLPFPCYQVSARFDGGMSGGPVFDEMGSLCGLVCSNLAGSDLDSEPVSYVTTLWPLFRGIINWDRGDTYPRGVNYPIIDLVRGGQIVVSDLPQLESWLTDKIGSLLSSWHDKMSMNLSGQIE